MNTQASCLNPAPRGGRFSLLSQIQQWSWRLGAILGVVATTASAQQTNLAVVVRHAPNLNGSGLIEGSVQQLLGESVTLNGGFTLTGDLLVPGTPTLLQNGSPNFGGTIVGSGSSTPTGYQVTLNGNCSLHYLRTRTTPVSLPTVSTPPQPSGTRSVTVNSTGQSIGDPATLRNLTLNGNAGQYVIPPGTYGNFIANGGSGFTIGVAGATNPAIYNLQNLTLNGQSRLEVVGPVILTVANGFTANGVLGATNNPSRLQLQLASGGFTLNGGCTVYGNVTTPAGTVIVNGNSLLVGVAQCDRLIINSGGIIRAGTTANQSPTATPQNLSVGEDGTLNVTLTGSDPENAALNYTVLSQPGHGTLTGTTPNLVYVPAANYHGADSFTFKVNDGQADSATATISITVTPVNDPPVAQSQTVSTPEDTALNLTLSGSDVENSPLTFQIVTPPSHGSLSNNAPNLSYTPNPNYNGPDNFTYRASDGQAQSAVATVSITVNPVDDAPVASAQTVTTDEDTATSITLTAVDVEGDGLDFTVLTQPAHGTLSGTPPNLLYTPTTNYNGSDSFTFRASDAWLDSDPATIILIVRPVNDVPVAEPQTIITAEDTATNLGLTATDADGDILSFNVVTSPTNGTLNGTAPELVFSPAADFHGTNVFTFVAVDGNSTSAPVAITLIITPVNDRPVAEAKVISLNEDATQTVSLSGTDVDGDALTYTVILQPTNGTLSGVAPNLTYTSATNYHGADVFSYVANDGITNSVPALVTLTIQSVNDAPVVTNQSLTTDEDTVLPVTLTGSDVENDALTFAVVTPPAHGTLSDTPPALIYTPATNYHGADSFTFSANDGQADSTSATIFVTVNPINDAPTATPATVNTLEDTPVTVTLSGSDEEGDALSFKVTASPTHGSLSGIAPNLSYTPATNYFGPDHFSFAANDGSTNSQSAVISIIVAPMNDTPIVASQSLTTDEDVPLNVVLGGNDVDGDTLSFTVFAQPTHGTLNGIAPNLTYTPATNYNGPDSFTFVAHDGHVNSAVGTINLTVHPLNDAPVASAQSITTQEDLATNILLTGSDVDGDALSYSVVTRPAHGLLSGIAPNLIYTPATNYNGSDSFTFVANDSHINSASATVTITVSPMNDAPTAQNLTITASGGQPANGTLIASDVDGDTLSFSLQSQGGKGTTVVNASGSFTYTPQANATGTDSFVFRVSDGAAFSTATVTVTLSLVNHVPIVQGQSLTTDEDVPLAVSLIGSDADDDPLTFEIISGPSQGTFLNGIYTPAENFNGTDSFEFIARDGMTNSSPANVTITISPINDAPRIHVPGIQTVIQGTMLHFDYLLPVSIDDADHNNNAVQLSISAPNGILVLDYQKGLSWISEPNNPTNPVVQGSVDSINSALNGWGHLTYVSPTNFSGDMITFTLDDLGNTGAGGNKTTTRTIQLIPANVPPQVAIAAPTHQSQVLAGGPVMVEVAADDMDGQLTSVKLYADGTLVADWPAPPYTWVWSNAPLGDHVFFATAVDDKETTATTPNVRISVVEPGSGDFTVNAGEDQTIQLSHAALLGGVLQITTEIPGAETNIVWSKVSGPGSVVFSTPNRLDTSAVFGEPGDYVLILRVGYAGGQRSDTLLVTVLPEPPQRLTTARSSKGTEFWLTFLPQIPGSDYGIYNTVLIAAEVDTEVTLIQPHIFWTPETNHLFVAAGTVAHVPVDSPSAWFGDDAINGLITSNVVHIIASKPVSAYGFTRESFTADGYLALPTALWGTNYMLMSYPGSSSFAFVAVEDNTHIQVVPTASLESRRTGLQPQPAGQPLNLVLHRGQSYRIGAPDYTSDYTGTTVSSDKPIAVFSGAVNPYVPTNYGYSDHLVEQVTPINTWGKYFATMPLATRTGDTFRFLASANGTRVSVNGEVVAVLNSGQYHERILTNASVILASQPVLVAQFANGQDFDGTTGDPFMMLLPPVEQFGGDYVLDALSLEGSRHYWEEPYWGYYEDDPTNPGTEYTSYMSLVTFGTGVGNISLDGQLIPTNQFQAIGNSGYFGAQLAVSNGNHRLSAPAPFGVSVYGWSPYESYAFLGGIYTESVEADTQLLLTQVTPLAAVGGEKFVVAHVTNGRGMPLPDLEVTFTTSGAHTVTNRVKTSRSGDAVFTYTGTIEGPDAIAATLVDRQQFVTNVWVIPTGNTPPLVYTTNTMTLQYGLVLQLSGTALDAEQSIGNGLSPHWKQLDGPGTAFIANPNQVETQAICSEPGLYVFEFSASDEQFSSRTLTTIRVDLVPGILLPKPYTEIPSLVVVGTEVQLTSEAWDFDDGIDRVEFFANGSFIGVSTTNEWWTGYGLLWTPATNGWFNIQAVAYDTWAASATSSVAVVQATYAPQVVIDNIPDSTVLTVPTNVLIHAQAFDPDGSIMSLSLFVNGELYGTTNNSDLTVRWFPRRQGDYTLSATAVDNLGIVTSSETISVTVTGIFPHVVITNPVPQGFAYETPTGKPILLAADASIAAPYTITNVVFTAWEVELNDSEPPYQIQWAPQRGNSYYQFVAEAYADSGAIGTSAGVYVHTFVDAFVSFAKPASGQTVYVGRPQPLQMQLRDPWNILEQNTFEFYLPTGWLTPVYLGRTTNNGVLYWTPPAPGEYTLIAVGSPFYFWTSVIVTAVEPPPIENVKLVNPENGASIYAGATTPLVIAFDSPTNVVDYWEAFANGTTLGTSTNTTLNWTPATTNDYVLTAVVHDHAGNTYNSTNSITVHVMTPPRPVAAIVEPSEDSLVPVNTNTIVMASVEDPGSITTNIQFYVDGVLAYHGSQNFPWIPTLLGNHTLHCVVITSDGDSIASEVIHVTVAEMRPPTVTILSPTNEQRIASGSIFVLGAQAHDPDGSITNIIITMDVTPRGDTNGPALAVAVSNINPGWHETTAQTFDNQGLMAESETIRFFIERSEVSTYPVPNQLSAAVLSASEIQLSWLPVATNVVTQSIVVERWNPERTLWTEVAEVPVAETNYLDSNLHPETNYRYRAMSIDTNGNRSALSNETNATTRTVVPNYAVVDLSAAVTGILTNRGPGGNLLTHPEQTHFDVRRTVALDSRHAALVLGTNYAALSRAMARFNERWPQIQLDLDPVLLSPHSILPRAGFLTGPGGSGVTVSAASANLFDPTDPARPVKAFLQEHQALFGFGPAAITNAIAERDYVSPVTGARTLVWQQQVAGIPVFNARFIGHVTATGELASVSCDFIPSPTAAANTNLLAAVLAGEEFPVSNPQALLTAVTNVGDVFDLTALTGESPAQGVVRRQTYTGNTAIKGEAHVELTWFPASRNELKLARQVIFTSQWRNEMYLTVVSAVNNEILYRRNLTADSSDASYRVFTGNSPTPMLPGLSVPGTAQAAPANRSVVTLTSVDAIASPDGWIPDGLNETQGNNVAAHLDRNDDNLPDLPRPTGNPARMFDFQLDFNGSPASYGDAATVQLFYWNNWMHDALYILGFTEAAGNFQNNNFGHGGFGGDAVQADAQDGASLNDGRHHDNANMSTPPDGYAPRMQMYTFAGATPDRDGSLDAEIILHEYTHGLSARLIGGGAGIDALQTAGMGEGWSDFYALALLTDPTADVEGVYPLGAYVTHHGFGSEFEENYYYGIRRYPYCTDTNKNPLTFADIDPSRAIDHTGVPRSPLHGSFRASMASEVHNQGEVWAMMLWEVRANLIRKHGAASGHNLTLQLVTEGLRLSPPNPNFVQARDAILLADRVLTDGANAAEVWAAFTKRGLGYEAKAPYSYTTSGVTESYTPAPALVIEQVQIQGGNGNGIIETNEDNSLLIYVSNQGTGAATGVSLQITTTTPGVQILSAQSGYDDIPSGQARGNNVLLQLRTPPEFVDGTRIDVNVTVSSAQQTVTSTLPFYPGNSGPKLPAGDSPSLNQPTSGSGAMRDLTPWDLGNLEPLWMAEDASCLLKAGDYKYILWKPDGSTNLIANPQYKFLAHRLTRHGVVVGTVIEPDTTDEAGNKVRHSWGAYWDFATGKPVSLTASQYSWPKNAGPLGFYDLVYSTVVTNEFGDGIFLTNVTSYPTLQTAWDLNLSGFAVGSVSMQATFGLQRLLFDPLGNMDWFTETERGLDAGIGRAEWATQTAYSAQLITAALFYSPESWRWLGPLNWDSTVSCASLINDAGMAAGSAAVLTGDPALDFHRPTHAFRAPATGEAAPFLTLITDLGTLAGGLHSFPRAINQAGDMVGYSDFDVLTTGGLNASPANVHAVYWGSGESSPTNLGTLGPVPEAPWGHSDAYAINDSRQIVGTALRVDANSGTTRSAGVLWQWNESTNATPGWEINDLDQRLNDDEWRVLGAMSINSNGWILAKGEHFVHDDDGNYLHTEKRAILLVPSWVLADINRDGTIDRVDASVTESPSSSSFGVDLPGTGGRPFYFWINDDRDRNFEIGKGTDDIPGYAPDRILDWQEPHVQGIRDLNDYFPLYLDIDDVLKLFPPGPGISYKFRQNDTAVKYVYTDLTRETAFNYLTNFNTAHSLRFAENHWVVPAGVALDADWLKSGKRVLLVEGAAATSKPLVLSVETANHTIVTRVRLKLKMSGVESMYRHLNLRNGPDAPAPSELPGKPYSDELTDRVSQMGEPSGYPDSVSNGKWLVMVHGYNVGPTPSRSWEAEMFKRFYWSGSKSRFIGVHWLGNPDGEDVPADYHQAGMNAYPTANKLAAKINSLPGRKTIVGHSMGCLVSSLAITDFGLRVDHACLLDAAVAAECYDGGAAEKLDIMAYPPWTRADKPKEPNYPRQLWSSDWYKLFQGGNDARQTLTWINRFTNAIPVVHNFYSSTEEVLGIFPGSPTQMLIRNLKKREFSRYCWVIQEKAKGNKLKLFGLLSLTGSDYGGWGFNFNDPLTSNLPRWYTVVSDPSPGYRPYRRIWTPAEIGTPTQELLDKSRFHPLFKSGWGSYDPEVPEAPIFNTFARSGPAWIMDLYDLYNPNTGNTIAADPVKRMQLLCEAIPALSKPMGQTAIRNLPGRNHNMPLDRSIGTDRQYWVRGLDESQVPIWFHSDIRDLPYQHVHSLFDSVTKISNQ